MKVFYVYLWLREDGTPYYVGKGSKDRGFESWGHRVKRPTNRDQIILQEYETESEAFEAEKFLIEYYGRFDLGTGCLANLTVGGEGVSGAVYSASRRKALSLRMLGKKCNLGHKHTEETKEKIRQAFLGKPSCRKNYRHSEETRKKISEANKGKRWSETRHASYKKAHAGESK